MIDKDTTDEEIELENAEARIKELNAHFCSYSVDGSCNLSKSEVKNEVEPIEYKPDTIDMKKISKQKLFNLMNDDLKKRSKKIEEFKQRESNLHKIIKKLEASLKDADADINKLNKDLIELEDQLKQPFVCVVCNGLNTSKSLGKNGGK